MAMDLSIKNMYMCVCVVVRERGQKPDIFQKKKGMRWIPQRDSFMGMRNQKRKYSRCERKVNPTDKCRLS